ncbi:RDD family protein [Ningiella sp. W23]|uniref:RDD family protein n=1 Tax=Ningiella sp. W23 TaxID=3023715 RepID=UPI003756D4E5
MQHDNQDVSNEKASENIYAAPEADLQVLYEYDSKLVLADRLKRLGAVVLDTLIIIVLAGIGGLIMALYSGLFSDSPNSADLSQSKVPFMIAIVMSTIYFLINGQLLYRYGQTIGKRFLKIKIVRRDGSRASFRRLLSLRIVLIQLLYQVPLAGSVFSLVNALFIFREDRRCIHDMIADTIVIDAPISKIE